MAPPPPEAQPSPDSSAQGRVSETGTGASEPGQTLGRYRLLKKIARGGMAEVFAARSFGAHGFEKTVAIKRILPRYGQDPQFVRMMVDEAKITVLLNHPNVATILELCEQDGDYFIVMEFVPGQSLSAMTKRLREKGERIGVLEACFIVVELLQGLHAAHVQKEASGKPAHIIHRDVSPQNVLVSFDGHVKVIDFGIARAMHRLEMTEVGTIKGKLRYLAPEMIDPGRFMKSGDFDHRVDVFAAGIVLWELIAARTLYQGDDEMVVYDAITDSDAPDLARMGMCDGALAKIVGKALTRDPEKRYLAAEDFADDLRAYVYRTDPAFTHKRIAAALERLFPTEKEDSLALERGVIPGTAPAPRAKAETTAQAPVDDRSHPPIEGALEKAAPAPQPRQIAPDDATRTQGMAASGPNKPSPRGDVDKPKVESTRQMRTGDSSKRLPQSEVAPSPSTSPSTGAGKKVIPVDDEAGPAQGDVLTVMTLVSRSGPVPGKSASPRARDKEALKADFRVGGETLTASDDPRALLALERDALSDPPSGAVDEPNRSSRPTERPVAAGAVDETPHTRERSRDLPRRPARAESKARPRLLLAAASGVGIALIVVVALELSRPPRPPPPPRTPDPVRVVVKASASGAVARALGREVPVPATFSALPGDSLEIVVDAPGHAEQSVRVSVPRAVDGVPPRDETVEVRLVPEPVQLVLEVEPDEALVLVDEAAYRPGMLLEVGKPVMLHVSAPGYLPFKREIEVRPGVEQIERVQLRPDPTVKLPEAKPEPKHDPKSDPKPRDRVAATSKTGTLVLKTKDMWGQVTIDGKTFDETTPLTVELKAGKHNVVVAHPPKGYKKTFTVTLKPGETVTRTIDFE